MKKLFILLLTAIACNQPQVSKYQPNGLQVAESELVNNHPAGTQKTYKDDSTGELSLLSYDGTVYGHSTNFNFVSRTSFTPDNEVHKYTIDILGPQGEALGSFRFDTVAMFIDSIDVTGIWVANADLRCPQPLHLDFMLGIPDSFDFTCDSMRMRYIHEF